MKNIFFFFIISLLVTARLHGKDPVIFNTQWIPSQPEVLTYRSKSNQGEGLYQVSIMKRGDIIEAYINMISPGFTKTVSGTMTLNMIPLQSEGKIIIDNQVMMETKCIYESDKIRITTLMMPYNRVVADTINLTGMVVDFTQVPFLVRMLYLKKDAQYMFKSLNPKTNTIVPLTLKVSGEGYVHKVDCYKVEINDFEGRSIYWIEKDSHHRVILVEQPESLRTTELLE